MQPRAEWELSTEAWLFVWLAAGDASWVDDRSSLLLRANEVFVVPPNRRGTLRASRLTVVTVVYFRFQPELLAGFLTVQERSQVERTADARGPSRIYGATHELAREFKALCEARSDRARSCSNTRFIDRDYENPPLPKAIEIARCADTDRVNGWAEILGKLSDPEAGLPPKLFIHRRCTRLLECLPMLQHDPNRPEDVLKVDAGEDGVGGDDAADAMRYLIATKARTVSQRKLRGI